jgi:hypothetical protein
LSLLAAVQLLTAKTAVWQAELPKWLKDKKFLPLLCELTHKGHFYFAKA